MTDEREPKVLHALIYPLLEPPPPPLMMTEPTDADLYGATQWRSHIVRAPRAEPAPIQYLSGMWKRRDGHGVQTDLPTGGAKSLKVQQLDPWARRSPPAVDV